MHQGFPNLGKYLWFDEGIQGYGRLWNAALENFATEDYIVFMEAGVYPEKASPPNITSLEVLNFERRVRKNI